MNKNLLALSVAAAAMAFSASAAVSSNIVGYVKLNLKKGQNLVTNPLNNTASNGNKVSTLFGSINCSVYRWTGQTFATTDIVAGFGVVSGVDFDLAPGESVFVDAQEDISITTVGDALVGTQTVSVVPVNNFVGSKVPIAGTATALGLAPVDPMTVYTWDTATQGFVTFDYAAAGVWAGAEPSFAVGQGFVIQSDTPFTWSKTFTVQ